MRIYLFKMATLSRPVLKNGAIVVVVEVTFKMEFFTTGSLDTIDGRSLIECFFYKVI